MKVTAFKTNCMKIILPFFLLVACFSYGQVKKDHTSGISLKRIVFRIADHQDSSFLTGASVIIEGTNTGVVSDENGYATLEVSGPGLKKIIISCIGFREQQIDKLEQDQVMIFLERETRELEEVVVVSRTIYCRRIVCTFCGIHIAESIAEDVRKSDAPGFSFFMYPNPVSKNSLIHFRFSFPFTGNIHVFNSSGQLVKEAHMNTGKNLSGSLQLPALAPGIYFVSIINSDKTSLTERILIH